MLNLLKFIPMLLFVSVVAGRLVITRPSSSVWWVAKSLNEIVWTCRETDKETFTILVNNKDPKILTAPKAVIAIQQNYDCSITITQQQADQPVGTGWTVLFANPLNNTEVYATSEEFEIKPLGSLYPSQVSSSAASSASSPAVTGKSGVVTSGGVSLKAGLGVVSLVTFSIAMLFA